MGERQESLWSRINRNLRYIISGVWNDTRDHWSVKMVKIINLSVQSFLDRDLQLRAASLTYSTVLAIVPALAMLFAIARGFGFQNLMQSELLRYFPSQRQALENALVYVDNYLSQASQGIFIGIGLIFLLWTLVSLMSNVENTFNHVWGITTRRSLQRKFTDYSALFLLLPVLIVCSAGISIFMSDAVQHVFEGKDLSPMVHRLLSFMPTFISWIIFTAAYYMVPNTRVKLTGALCAGILCGTLFQVVQMLFMSGQIYVSKYNAIYGSFAFLPLMLVWMQISWLITLAGVVLTYAWQNFDSFVYRGKAQEVSPAYSRHLTLAVLALAAKRFKQRDGYLTRHELIYDYDIPGPLADSMLEQLQRAGLICAITGGKHDDDKAFQPACDPDDITIVMATNALADQGHSHFIVKADERFAPVLKHLEALRQSQQEMANDVPLYRLL